MFGDLSNSGCRSELTGYFYLPQLAEEFDEDNIEFYQGGLWFGVDAGFNMEGQVTKWLEANGWHFDPETYDNDTLFAFPNDKVYPGFRND